MLKSDWSVNRPIKFEHTFIPENLLCPIAKTSVLYRLSFSSYRENSHAHGLFGQDTYCSIPTMGLLSTLDVKNLDRKVVRDFPLDERACHAKFSCTGSYRDQIHKEQTNKQTFFFIYIDIQIYVQLFPLFHYAFSAPIHYESCVMKVHLTFYFLYSMDISIHTVALHLMHSIHFFSIILKCRVPNGKKRMFLYTFVLELLRIKQSHAQILRKRHLLQ